MRTKILSAVVLVAVLVVGPARATIDNYAAGAAKEDNGAWCQSDCLAVIYSHGTGITRSAAVNNTTLLCAGVRWNFGVATNWGCGVLTCCIVATGNSGDAFDVWIRHSCPNGYYYSPQFTASIQSPDGGQWFAGYLQLHKPAGGCFVGAQFTASPNPSPLTIELAGGLFG
jgi:hypothetical protein